MEAHLDGRRHGRLLHLARVLRPRLVGGARLGNEALVALLRERGLLPRDVGGGGHRPGDDRHVTLLAATTSATKRVSRTWPDSRRPSRTGGPCHRACTPPG